MTIENAFDYPANAAKPDSDKTKYKNPQAVALMTDLGSDRAVFANVKITGYQDTLFPELGPQLLLQVRSLGPRRLHLRRGSGRVRRLRHRLARPRQRDEQRLRHRAEHEGRSAVRLSVRAQPPEERIAAHVAGVGHARPAVASVRGRDRATAPSRSSIAGWTTTSARRAGTACRRSTPRARARGTSQRTRASSSSARKGRAPFKPESPRAHSRRGQAIHAERRYSTAGCRGLRSPHGCRSLRWT